MSEWVSGCVRRRVFPDNRLHCYGQQKTRKQNTTYSLNTKEKWKTTALANQAIYTLLWYALRPLIRKRSGHYSYSSGTHTGLFYFVSLQLLAGNNSQGQYVHQVWRCMAIWSPVISHFFPDFGTFWHPSTLPWIWPFTVHILHFQDSISTWLEDPVSISRLSFVKP